MYIFTCAARNKNSQIMALAKSLACGGYTIIVMFQMKYCMVCVYVFNQSIDMSAPVLSRNICSYLSYLWDLECWEELMAIIVFYINSSANCSDC